MLHNTRALWGAPALLLALGVSCLAADRQKVFTDPAKAGPDFAFQGEYVGTATTDSGEVKHGAQVIALGDGKFRGAGYQGGLPGDGWDEQRNDAVAGELKDGVVTFKVPDSNLSATLSDGKLSLKDGDKVLATFKKVERKSPTLGQKPPDGAVVLFDGTSTDKLAKGRMTDDGLLMVEVRSKQLFQSFKLHLEFRLPFQPYDRGQGRGNSGFYAQGRYEVQILDSFGQEGEDNECGGIYKVARPKVNMCLPPLAWQTYDVDFTAAEFKDGKKVNSAKMTVKHNGVLIHENVEVPHTTVGAILGKEGPEPGPIYLQDHGNPVRFRNIWVVEK